MPNARQNFANVAKDQFLEIKEFAANYSKRERKSLRLGVTSEIGLPHPTCPSHAQSEGPGFGRTQLTLPLNNTV